MATGPFFDARIIDDDILAVLIRGSLDSATTPEFDREIQKHLDEGRTKIIIDCRHLDYLSSVAVGRLVVLQKRMRNRGGWVKLATIHGPVAEVIELLALDKVLDIHPDLEFARESFHEERTPRRSLRKLAVWAIPVILAVSVVAVVLGGLARIAHLQSKLESVGAQSDRLENAQLAGLEDDSAEDLIRADVDDVPMLDGPPRPNLPPVANDDAYNVGKNTHLVVPAPGLLHNDTDPNPADRLLVVSVDTSGTVGSVDYWNDDGSFAYTTRAGHTGVDTFTYIATDGDLDSFPATVTITTSEITGPNRDTIE